MEKGQKLGQKQKENTKKIKTQIKKQSIIH